MFYLVLPVVLVLQVFSCLAYAPRRITINGSVLSEPESPLVPIKLRGFNFWVDLDQPLEAVDTAVTQLLPGTNLARLVMVHWQDAPAVVKRNSDCYTPTHPFLKPACLQQFDATVAWTTQNGLWTILTGRAKGGENGHVFNNDTLATEMIAMWSFLANRYSNTSNILGYEVLSEPRTLNNTQVHLFHVQACTAVWKQDPQAACLIGPGKYYNRYRLDESFIIKNRPVIYAGNYLTPKTYTRGSLSDVTYPSLKKIKCGDLLAKKEIPYACPDGDSNAEIMFNKDFLSLLVKPLVNFQQKFNVPVWVDQWGIFGGGSVGGGNKSVTAYMNDVLELWDDRNLMWTQWIWRSPYAKNCTTYSLVCQPVSCSAYYPQKNLLRPLNKYLGGDGVIEALPTVLSPLCKCINAAKMYCASAADCKKCVWQHESDLVAKGCDWNTQHSDIIEGACSSPV